MKSVLQLGLVAVLLAVMAPFAVGEGARALFAGSGADAAGADAARALARRASDSDARRGMATGAEREVAIGERRSARASGRSRGRDDGKGNGRGYGRGYGKGTASLIADRRGHFLAEAIINRRPIDVLVDTGASSVAMSRSTARRLGVRVRRSDFVHTANTANGRIDMAVATLDRVRVGGVELRDVEAAVLPDGALDGVLLGMSFLGRLDSFRVEGGRLLLVQ